jgi:hypothetical protein
MNTTHENRTEGRDQYRDLLFSVRRSARYHQHRVRFFDQLGKGISVVTMVSGIGTVTSFISSVAGPWWTGGCAAAVAFFSAVDLVCGFSGKARLHTGLYRQWIDLEKRMICEGPSLSERQQAGLMTERLSIEKDEPPVLSVLDVICHNELVRAMECGRDELVHVAWWQRMFADLVDLHPHGLRKASDI